MASFRGLQVEEIRGGLLQAEFRNTGLSTLANAGSLHRAAGNGAKAIPPATVSVRWAVLACARSGIRIQSGAGKQSNSVEVAKRNQPSTLSLHWPNST